MKIVKGTGKVLVALMFGVMMPLLIWVGMGIVLNRAIKEDVKVKVEKLAYGRIRIR